MSQKMRCRKHITDFTSSIGVCATCLRHRLSAILAAQSDLPSETPEPPPIPRSVSPYISCRNSDATWKQNVLFYNTPQVIPAVTVEVKRKKTGRGRISELILGLFRSKSVKPDPGRNLAGPVENHCSGGSCARTGGKRPGHSRNVSGFNFSMSPMVRPSPITVANGEIRAPTKQPTSFCKNRSRKLADFGRYNY